MSYYEKREKNFYIYNYPAKVHVLIIIKGERKTQDLETDNVGYDLNIVYGLLTEFINKLL